MFKTLKLYIENCIRYKRISSVSRCEVGVAFARANASRKKHYGTQLFDKLLSNKRNDIT